MDFEGVFAMLNELLSRKQPATFSSSWVLKHAPKCYRFIQREIRTDFGEIDWDRVTRALDFAHQRRWQPRRKWRKRNPEPYADAAEVTVVLSAYRADLYVFLAAATTHERQLRDIIGVALVRLAQRGNQLARAELMTLLRYTIDDWIDNDQMLSRWRGFEDGLREQVEGCIRRYRYSGSFLRYLRRTLECAARGLRPFHAYSLDGPLTNGLRYRSVLLTGNVDEYTNNGIVV